MIKLLVLITVFNLVVAHPPGKKPHALTAVHKKELEKTFHGINLENRKDRLKKLGSWTTVKGKGAGLHRAATIDLKKDIVPVEITGNATDLFDVNREEGVDEYLFEGDIHLTEEQLEDMEKSLFGVNSTRSKRQLTSIYSKWTDAKVPYYMDNSLSQRKRASIAAAMQYIQSRTCIEFINSYTARNRIKIISGGGCYSSVGMTGGEQTLSIGDGCEVIGTVAHELTHALGSWHMQSRDDRDYYVTINLQDVPSGTQYNFAKKPASQLVDYTPYEYGSFMHYGATAFVYSANGMSIIPRDTSYVYTIGNRQISFYDMMFLNKHYGCEARCPSSDQCENGGTPNPDDCSKCNCPGGYGGRTCNERPSGCGSSLTAGTDWKSQQIQLGSSGTGVQDTYNTCTHWITAPEGTSVQVRIVSVSNSQCSYGCSYNGIEIKTKPEQRVVNPRICCQEFTNRIFTSQLNPTPVISYNRFDVSTFNIEYRYVGSPSSSTPSGSTTDAATQPQTTAATAPPTTSRQQTCGNVNGDANCAALKPTGFCTPSSTYNIDIIKYNCAAECGLCGVRKSPCRDIYSGCALLLRAGWCASADPSLVEYHCASTCGFCANPN